MTSFYLLDSLADEYLLKILLQSKPDFKIKVIIVYIKKKKSFFLSFQQPDKQKFINQNEQNFIKKS
jgi:hypothetical protein